MKEADEHFYKKKLEELQKAVGAKNEVLAKRIHLSRLLTAYQWAVMLKERSETQKPDTSLPSGSKSLAPDSADWELPLAPEDENQMHEDWKKYGGFQISHRLYPAEKLKNRLFR